ncbi:MAG: molybdopterin-binding protein [Leptotrichiaceae bacterium]|nr:molybdopterin-binding protein [Leptotrichiaceae bacterium]
MSKIKAEILCIGTELLVGDIVNTNARYISEKLTNIGVDLYYQTTVGDNFGRVKECLKTAFNRVELVITTGGLGPTMDDITKEVVADFFREELEVNEKYYSKLMQRYYERGFGNDIPDGGKKEASIIKGSRLIENEMGLAPGFYYEKNNKKIIVLPGPPKEMTWMMDNQVLPLLSQYSESILIMKTLEIKGVPEGKIDDSLKEYFQMSNPTVAPYAKEGRVQIRVAMKGSRENKDLINKEINKVIEKIRKIYPEAVEVKKTEN